MAQRLITDSLVIASHNPGKISEIRDLLRPFELAIQSAADLGLPEPEETGTTFSENATLKAIAAAEGSGKAALADDSGLVIPALGGAPGIYSGRWAGPEKDFDAAMARIEKKLGLKANREAHFVCVLALALPGGETRTYEGMVHGTLVWPPKGTSGFGYDPMFRPKKFSETFGEMHPPKKHQVSHRAEAFSLFTADQFGDA